MALAKRYGIDQTNEGLTDQHPSSGGVAESHHTDFADATTAM